MIDLYWLIIISVLLLVFFLITGCSSLGNPLDLNNASEQIKQQINMTVDYCEKILNEPTNTIFNVVPSVKCPESKQSYSKLSIGIGSDKFKSTETFPEPIDSYTSYKYFPPKSTQEFFGNNLGSVIPTPEDIENDTKKLLNNISKI